MKIYKSLLKNKSLFEHIWEINNEYDGTIVIDIKSEIIAQKIGYNCSGFY